MSGVHVFIQLSALTDGMLQLSMNDIVFLSNLLFSSYVF